MEVVWKFNDENNSTKRETWLLNSQINMQIVIDEDGKFNPKF